MANDIGDSHNPARRLLSLLEAAVKTKANSQIEGWCKVFGIEEVSDEAAVRKLVMVYDLLDEARSLIESLNLPDPTVYYQSFDALLPALDLKRLGANWSEIVNRLKEPSTLIGLRFVATKLDEDFVEIRIPDETLNALQDNVRGMYQSVCEMQDLDHTLRLYVLDALDSLLAAIKNYEIRGSEALFEAIDQAIGTAVRLDVKQADGQRPKVVDQLLRLAKGACIVANAGTRVVKAGNRFLHSAESMQENIDKLLN